MIKKVEYNDTTQRQQIIEDNSTLVLIEEQNITEGNFLIFSDTPREKEIIYTNVPEKEFTDLKVQLESSQEAIDFLLMGGI